MIYRMVKVGIVMQARMGSTRLPKKTLMELKGKTVLLRLIERIKRSTKLDDVIIATTTDERDDVIVDFARKKGIKVFRGDENDVLDRYVKAGEYIGADIIVRITADNCFTDPEVMDAMIKHHLKTKADYTCINGLSYVAPEIANLKSLKQARVSSEEEYDHEHVTPYLRNHKNLFKVEILPNNFDILRPEYNFLTIDTKEDFDFISEIIENLDKGKFIELKEVYNFLDNNPELIKKYNKKQVILK